LSAFDYFLSYDVFECLGARGREGLRDVIDLVLFLDKGLIVLLDFLDESRSADSTLPFLEVDGLFLSKSVKYLSPDYIRM